MTSNLTFIFHASAEVVFWVQRIGMHRAFSGEAHQNTHGSKTQVQVVTMSTLRASGNKTHSQNK